MLDQIKTNLEARNKRWSTLCKAIASTGKVKVVFTAVISALITAAFMLLAYENSPHAYGANSIILKHFPSRETTELRGYVMPDNTIRIPKQTYIEVFYPFDTGYDEPVYYPRDFIPLNGDELVISYDSDHIYIIDAFEIGEKSPLTGKYGTSRGEADTLIRVQ